ncbi:hypothetical protein PLICRDRAFT_40215 [Plicaturopsis crispa FD-325 SS-3]|nr:hypothetical protein PLICRDRAFT_40215 [Plicaturopsis crispa FD-325 SS-3]
MIDDSMHGDNHEDSENEDSLFGSPPPSPGATRGRSPSPSLALPSGPGSAAQNVGTIALPGSQPYSELAVNPPASSLSGFSHHGFAQRPQAPAYAPAQPQQSYCPVSRPQPLPLRHGSQPLIGRKKKAAKEKSATPRPAPPPIPLPDPDAPPPANFLRNQQALLGLAGLVGGVHPANLSVQRHTRGSNPDNPIVVEEDGNAPRLGYKSRLPVYDLSRLPVPTNEEIVASLIKQRNIFPVLGSILKLIAAGDASRRPPVDQERIQQKQWAQSRRSSSPASKRRKLANVPAGAADWDVPYPFPNGEGPDAYRATWERERGKQLIAQLVGLIKSAAEKAAARSHAQRQEVPQKRSYYRPATALYGLERPPTSSARPPHPVAPEVLVDHSNVNAEAARSSRHNTQGQDQSKNNPETFDQIIATMFSGQSNPPAPNLVSSPSSTAGSSNPPDDFDLDNFMSVLNSYSTNEIPNTAFSPEAFSNHDYNRNFDATAMQQTLESMANDADAGSTNSNSIPDYVIDPTLLAMSTQQPSSSSYPANSSAPALSHSPVESSSSFAGPSTPQFESISPDPQVFTGDQAAADDPMTAATMLLDLATNPLAEPIYKDVTPSGVQPVPPSTTTIHHRPIPTSHSVASDLSSVWSMAGTSETVSSSTRASAGPSSQPQPTLPRCVGGPGRPAAQPIRKDEVLAKAKERRRQLVAEIERAKVELWETTIEQGVLAQLAKEAT